jgi:hypothetical protein
MVHFTTLVKNSDYIMSNDKSKTKAVPLQHAGAEEERKYSSYSFLTLALHAGEW